MDIATRYLLSDNLHCNPTCSRLGRGVLYATAVIRQNASETKWHGHVVRLLSKLVLFTGALAIIPLSLIEGLAVFIITGIGLAIEKSYNFIQGMACRQSAREFARHSPEYIRDSFRHFEIDQNTAEERAYQNTLAELLRISFLEIHRTPALSACLNNEDQESGTERLESLDASIYVPLTAYTQYREVLQPIQCPERFTGNLTRYNTTRQRASRHDLLVAAHNQVAALSPAQKERLVQKILRGADLQLGENEAPIQQVFLSISSLAPALYQGPLMTKMALNEQAADGNYLFVVRNLFQNSCQRALEEIAHAQENAI